MNTLPFPAPSSPGSRPKITFSRDHHVGLGNIVPRIMPLLPLVQRLVDEKMKIEGDLRVW